MQRAYIETRPAKNAIYFMGHYIKLRVIAQQHHLDHGYLYKILSGQRVPSVAYLIALAKVFDVTVDELLAAIEERKLELENQIQNALEGLDWVS